MTYRGTVHVRAHWRRLYPRGQSPNTQSKSTYARYKRRQKYYTSRG